MIPTIHEDPFEAEQVLWLKEVIGREISEKAMVGLQIIGPRFVDDFGRQRINGLEHIFQTHSAAGKDALLASLENMGDRFTSWQAYGEAYPVTIIPPKPSFPMMKIMHIEKIVNVVYRVFDSRYRTHDTGEELEAYIKRTGRLPAVPAFKRLVRRSKPKRIHWCSYTAYETPDLTAAALQITPAWSDCSLRTTLCTKDIRSCTYIAYNGDMPGAANDWLEFGQYFTEPLAEDHPPQEGGGIQIAVTGSPRVALLERWNIERGEWVVTWRAHT